MKDDNYIHPTYTVPLVRQASQPTKSIKMVSANPSERTVSVAEAIANDALEEAKQRAFMMNNDDHGSITDNQTQSLPCKPNNSTSNQDDTLLLEQSDELDIHKKDNGNDKIDTEEQEDKGDKQQQGEEVLMLLQNSQLREQLHAIVNEIQEEGMIAYRLLSKNELELNLSNESIAAKNAEISRLKESEAKHRSTIQNLLQALDKNRNSIVTASNTSLMETQLRSQVRLMTATTERAIAAASLAEEKYKTMEMELQQAKTKIIQLDRERRVSMTWAKNADTNVSSDCDYYKRKVRVRCLLFRRYIVQCMHSSPLFLPLLLPLLLLLIA